MSHLTGPSAAALTENTERRDLPGEDDTNDTQALPSDYWSPSQNQPSSRNQLLPGDILCGRFRIVKFLAAGGMGEVFEAADEQLQGKRVALKTLRADLAEDPAARARLELEVLLAREISHTNVCPAYDIFREEAAARLIVFFTLKLVAGESLAAHLARTGRLELIEAEPLIRQMAAALDAAHQAGVIHRDFKPSNVMLEQAGRRLRVLVTDFGLSRACDAEISLAETGQLFGTIGYLAPELLNGNPASSASDVYAFGVVVHEMLTGKKPVNEPGSFTKKIAPSKLVNGLPPPWDRIILGCVASEPSQRFKSAGKALELLTDLKPSSNRLPPAGAFSRRRLLRAGATASVTGVAGAWFGWPRFDSLLHPLPPKRFVALMAWPAVDTAAAHSLLTGLLDAIRDRLARAEAYVKDLLIISARDVAGQTAPAGPKDAVSSLGANLVLAASLESSESICTLLLALLDASTSTVLRHGKVSSNVTEPGLLAEKGADLAARLLDVPAKPVRSRDQAELANLQPGAYLAFSDAEELKSQPNNAGLDGAIEKYQKALELDPQFSLGYAKLAMAYIAKFQAKRERAYLELAAGNSRSALTYNSSSLVGLLAQALVLLYSGRTEEARRQLANTRALDPGNPEIAFYEALSYRYLGQWPEAEKAWKDLVAARPNFWPAYNDWGWTLHRQGRYREAADLFEQGATVAPRVAMPLANAGTMYLLLDRKKDARDAFEASLKRSPNQYAYLSLGSLEWEARKYREALAYYQKASALKPQDDMTWRNIGDCYAVLGKPRLMLENYAKAAAILRDQLRTNPTAGFDWMTLAFYEAKLGNRRQAETDIAAAEARGAADVPSQFTKAQALALLGEKEQALSLLLSCLKRGLSPVEVELALDLSEVRADARYHRQLAARQRATS